MTTPIRPSSDPKSDPKVVAQAGFEALRRGDNAQALDHFLRLHNAGHGDASTHFALAIARQRTDDPVGALQAINAALAVAGAGASPSTFQMLLLKADLLAASGAHREASGGYLAAVRSANAQADLFPPALASELSRAERACEAYAADLERQILQQLREKDPSAIAKSPRIRDAVDIMFGRKQAFTQRPRFFFFPELASVPFFDASTFPWVAALEAETDVIRSELEAVLRDDRAFRPYVEGDPKRPGTALGDQNGMLNNPDWSAFYLWKHGSLVADNAARCPKTVAAMSRVPLTQIPNRSPSVLFSLLRAGAHIPPHNGLINTRLIVHLPIIVPGNCRLRVGNETREWTTGKVWLFDDTIEHEAWNDSDETRVILLFEVDRPDISKEEQSLVREIFTAIDANAGQSPEWEI